MTKATIFQTVKAAVTPLQAASLYGLEPQRGMIRCPFHDDHNPSMKLYDDHAYCFSCQKRADVIDLTAQIFGLRPIEAARKLASDFHVDESQESVPSPPQAPVEKLELELLQAYLCLLRLWKQTHFPKTPEEPPDDRFTEACTMLVHAEALMDQLVGGTQEEKAQVVAFLNQDARFLRLQNHVKEWRNISNASGTENRGTGA